MVVGCERRLRKEGLCPFARRCRLELRRAKLKREGTANPALGVCTHSNRCFACDDWSCIECRLERGDGDDVTRLAAQLGGDCLVLLDFDRTLCSTRAGADPCPPPRNAATNSAQRDGRKQPAADEALLELCTARQGFGTVFIVTRNSHEASIRTFLDQRGLDRVTVRSVKNEKTSKAQVIADLLHSAGEGSTAVFADDDLDELLPEKLERLAKQGRLHRVLFTQTIAR